jgi:hypothetical protein
MINSPPDEVLLAATQAFVSPVARTSGFAAP